MVLLGRGHVQRTLMTLTMPQKLEIGGLKVESQSEVMA
jgi:hypothetical protein